MKVAIVYDRVNKWGGAERVLLALNELFPDASLYTSLYDEAKASWAKAFPEVKSSFLQRIPFAKSRHEWLPFLMPLAFENLDLKTYDLVISVTSESAKGVITFGNTKHICYCLTPTRYLWSGYEEYFNNSLLKTLSNPFVNYLKKWDKVASKRPDKIIAISNEVKDRIKKYYALDSTVVYPPVDLKKFSKKKRGKGKYYLVVSRLVPYKKVDLVVDAFNQSKEHLIVVGSGSEDGRLKRNAKSNIEFVKNLTDERLVDYYTSAKALICPQLEDFGLVAVEAQAAGLPVIAFARGGVRDIVIDTKTGVFFNRQSVKSLLEAIDKFSTIKFDSNKIAKNAERFSNEKFKQNFLRVINL